MTISDDLFRAILAMDTYNRGYNAGIDFGANADAIYTQIGNAAISARTTPNDTAAQAASFYALAYTWNNHQIISYRGTDSLSTDPVTGWLSAIGLPQLSQPMMAAQFYKDVINNSTVSPYNSTVEFTGHSLGGGLAGFMAGLYGKKAVIFDNMPFESLTYAAHDLDPIVHAATYNNYYFNGATPSPENFTQISGYFIDDEVLETARLEQVTPVQALDIGPGIDFPGVDSGLLGGNRHSISVLILGLYGQQSVSTVDWKVASKFFMPLLFDNDIAIAADAGAFRGAGTPVEKTYNVMRDAIAYSAIDVGVRVFGDTSIRALFDDAMDLGKVPGLHTSGTFINAAASDISKIFVQYAGQLAIGKILQTAQPDALNGVLTYDQPNGKLTVDLAPAKWANTDVNTPMDVKGRDTLSANLLEAIKTDNANSAPGSAAFTDYMKPSWASADSNNITKAVFVTGGGVTISETDAPNAKSGAKGGVILVGNIGQDILTGGDGRDLLVGGDGQDQLDGGKDSDFLFGGEDNDILKGGLGSDIMDGGQGTDTADYSDFSAGRIFTISKGLFNYGALSDLYITDVATSDVDILFNIEQGRFGAGADTLRLDQNVIGSNIFKIVIDGDNADLPSGDNLDFSNLTTGIKIISDPTDKNSAQLVTTSAAPDNASLNMQLGQAPSNTSHDTLHFTNFETITGTAQRDVLNLANIRPGGAATAAEQTQVDAAYQTFYAAVAGSVPISVYNQAVSTLVTTLSAIRPYQSTLTANLGDGNDIGKASNNGISTINGGAGVDVLLAGDYLSTLNGGDGTDWLIGGGLESHLNGGAGDDLFTVSNKTFIDDAGYEDFVTAGGFRLHGGVQQWWMENGFAYYTPSTSLISGALGAFGSVFTAASVLFDAALLSIVGVRYALSQSGQLVMQFARGRGGQAVMENYKTDADTGDATGHITVFKQVIGKATIADLREYVKSALLAGSGINAFNSDPLVLDLDGDGLELTRQTNGIYFEMDTDGFAERPLG